MASIKIIRRRIRSAQNIAQITKAMEMVAASKMKKAQEQAELGKAYADKIYEAVRELSKKVDQKAHPLLTGGNSQGKKLVIMISTTKGLAGGLNTNLFREVGIWFPKNTDAEYVTVGKKGESFIISSGRKLAADFSEKVPFIENVPPLTELLIKGFIEGNYSQVWLVYNSFINALKQLPTRKEVLPLSSFEEEKTEKVTNYGEFIVEPSVDEVLDSLLPHYLENQVRAAIFEAEASEQSARMIAMKNATDAAMDLMEALTLEYNRIRQEKITYEIADTVTARMALE